MAEGASNLPDAAKGSSSPDPGGAQPRISLPSGGGAIRGIGEKFTAIPLTGTGSLTVPIATSPGRNGFGPALALYYDSGAGNGPFGFGWRLALPSIARRTDKGLPRYRDEEEGDTFLLSGAEDLVPVLVQDGQDDWVRETIPPRDGYRIEAYRPRIEGLFARIERWTRQSDGDSYWRTISRDNVTSFYGKTPESRIADPADPTKVFSWLLCQSRDDRGNAVVYSYAAEDGANLDLSQVNERNRWKQATNRYPARIRYGNTSPLEAGEDPAGLAWLFEVVFDYGEGYLEDEPADGRGRVFTAASLTPAGAWTARQDPFSHYRAGFEIRTHRLCRRILMVHHFAQELGTPDCLVRATEFTYREDPRASFIVSVTQSGYARQSDGGYLKSSLPSLDLEYSAAEVDETVREIDAGSIENLPRGVDGLQYRWVDLDGEGLAGVLSEEANAWYYKRNLGGGAFAPVVEVASKPSIAALARGRQHFLDLAGDGRPDLVQFDGPLAGFQTRDEFGGWGRFRPFPAPANIRSGDRNLRFVDVTGDGFPDILVSEDSVFTWYESRAKEGFAPPQRTPKNWDEEQGPREVFSNPDETIFLADMSGDGLADILRIRYGEVCYWPNLGYGNFGAKITMDNAPVFDSYDRFEPRRIRLADIDGSGTTDIVYIGQDGITLHFNQAGNSWGMPYRLTQFPRVDDLTSVSVVDLKGNGTACLVWSSPLEADGGHPMRYIDLMGDRKPHLLVRIANNMGSETLIDYAASTKFYAQDRLEGRPWVTRLPFPVHVVARVESRDLVSKTTLVSSYRYRHGYFDGAEREYRGFAYVEQRDVESVTGEFDLPPVVSKTWFHNGAFLDGERIETYFKDPASREFFAGDAEAASLRDPDLPIGLALEEQREAARALKGNILRQEIYADDGTEKAALPYSVVEHSYKVVRLQPREPGRSAVFFSHRQETADYHYERVSEDPRVSHSLTLAVDDYGNVLTSATVGYQRRAPAFEEQGQSLATLVENRYTNVLLEDDAYRAPMMAETKTYELTAPTIAGAALLSFGAVEAAVAAAIEIAYEAQPTAGQTQKRLIGQQRSLYRKDDLSALLPLGAMESLALPGETYALGLTPGLLGVFSPNASVAEIAATLTGPEGQYRDLDGDGRLWLPSGQVFYSGNEADAAATELVFAKAHFFLQQRYRDPFGHSSTVAYDAHDLLLVSSLDAVGNTVSASYDYRVLQPQLVTDANGNRTEVRFDALGMLAATALRGKAAGAVEGDAFDNFTVDLAPADLAEFFVSANPNPVAATHLGSATTRIVYDLTQVPLCAASIAREIHVSDLPSGAETAVQLQFVYSDGFGRIVQRKAQAEPGPLDLDDPDSALADPRWVSTGEQVYNNKGGVIRQYEPFFSASPHFGPEQWGVSSTLFYDPVERVVAALRPNKTYEKSVFDPWRQARYDANDTCTFDPRTDPDVGAFFRKLSDADYLPTWHAQRISGGLGPEEQDAAAKAAAHADTPAVAHRDTLGRVFLKVSDNGGAGKIETRLMLDIEGNSRAVVDALGRTVMRYDYGFGGRLLHRASMEAGERWMLCDAAGKMIRGWDSRKYAFSVEYDAMRRPLRSLVQGGDPAEPNATVFAQPVVYERTIYGDSAETGLTAAQRQEANLKTRVFRRFDGAGTVTSDAYDFKGNPLRGSRQFASDYKTAPDWSQPPALEAETFTFAAAFDALNRPTEVTSPDDSVYRPGYNQASLLEKVDVVLRGASTRTAFVSNIDYDAKGRRKRIAYGNGATTLYAYDKETFRLSGIKTTRTGQNGTAAQIFKDPSVVQDLRHTYDATGNITRIADAALLTVFNGQQVDPVSDYTYDPLYRLTDAKGREHVGQSGFASSGGNYRDYPFAGLASLNDLQQLRNYTEHYDYDPLGNLLALVHAAGNGAGNWTRNYAYDEASLLEPGRKSNRLSRTALQAGSAPATENYGYDAHGNIREMPHLSLMKWTFKDEIAATARQVVTDGTTETTYYVYDGQGQRVRKITERRDGSRKNERLYLGGQEIYREFAAGGGVTLERETLHVMDDEQRIAIVETETVSNGTAAASPVPVQRYQFANHLGSASLELDETGALISYEEYSPYGATTFQAGRSGAEVSLKRYRYTGMERDEESGFAYHGARYYAPWLGRWMSCDPAGLRPGPNPYAFCHGNPIGFKDGNGCDPTAVGDPGDLPPTATLDDLKAYAEAHGYTYSDPNNERHYVDGPEGGRWIGGNLTRNVYDPAADHPTGFGDGPSRFEPDMGGTIPTGPYDTSFKPSSDKPKKSTPQSTKPAGNGGGTAGGTRTGGPPGGSATGAANGTAGGSPTGTAGATGTGEGSSSSDEDGWGWIPEIVGKILMVVAVVAIAFTGIGFIAEFSGALAAGFTITESATLATGAVMTGVGTSAFFGGASRVAQSQAQTSPATVASEVTTAEAATGGPPPVTYYGPFAHQINKGGLNEIVRGQQLMSTLGRYGDEAVRATMAPNGMDARQGFFSEGSTMLIFRTTVPPTSINAPQEWAKWDMEAGSFLNIHLDEIHLHY